jgi:muramoyltetrapeptide carboxypeptidase
MQVLPQPLRPGDPVRIVAASGPFDRDAFDAGVDLLRAAGLEPRFDPDIFARWHYLAGDDIQRLHQVQAAIAEPDVGAIWTARGGYGASRLLPALDPKAVTRAGKWLVGFSDTTALHCLWARAGVASVHGANVTTLSSWSPPARDALFAALFSGEPLPLCGQGIAGSGRGRGRLRGGNLAVLTSLAGTGHLPDFAGAVLLLEEVGERPYRVDRMLTQLRQAGVLEALAAVVVGQLVGCEESREPAADYTALDLLANELGGLGVPVVAGVPVGHHNSSQAVVLGREVVVDASAGTVTPV